MNRISGPERDAAITENLRSQPRQQRCVLDVDALEAWQPVRVPHSFFGGNSFPEATSIPWIHECDEILVTADDVRPAPPRR